MTNKKLEREDLKEEMDLIERRIRDRVAEMNSTMKWVIQMIGMTEAGFYRMLSNGTMKVSTLIDLAGILNVPETYFFGGSAKFKSAESENIRLKEKVNALIEKDKKADGHINELHERINDLRKQLKDKDELIELLKFKIEAIQKEES